MTARGAWPTHWRLARPAGTGWLSLVLLAAAPAVVGRQAQAGTLQVGPGQAFAAPSAAAAVAQDGDLVAIAPGTYFDCAVWRADRLVIAGTAPGVVITDRACEGKAAFVITGHEVTVRNVTFARVRVEDGNGAGIRAEGRDLTVQQSRFLNDQAGIISAAAGGLLFIDDCLFEDVGSNEAAQSRAIVAGPLGRLRIEHSVFRQARGAGGFIATAAHINELRDNSLSDAVTHAPLIQINNGLTTLEGNVFELGAAERPGAVLLYGDAGGISLRSNTLVEPVGHVPLLRNWSGSDAAAVDNTIPPGVDAVSEEGGLYRRLRHQLALARNAAGSAARLARHQVAELARDWKLVR